MEKPYNFGNEKFVIEQRKDGCEYMLKHVEWPEPVLTISIIAECNENSHRWGAKGPNVSIGADGSFQATVDACCRHIISTNAKGPTFEERCEEGTQTFNKL